MEFESSEESTSYQILDPLSVEPRKPDCPVCGFQVESITKLKTHLLLKHSELNLCLFCIEKKGWSDFFASSASYNEHYWNIHQGIIQKNEKKRNEEHNEKKSFLKKWKQEVKEAKSQGKPAPKRPSPKLVCTICAGPEFECDSEFDRHFITLHGYDYCKMCHLMGPSARVRLHILNTHPGQLCHICCGTSPQLEDSTSLNRHLANKHGLKTRHADNNGDDFRVIEYHCLDCDGKPQFSSADQLCHHISNRHLNEGESLRHMRVRRKRRKKDENNFENVSQCEKREELLPPLQRVCGVKNETLLDCFAIAGLHLLAQTDLYDRLSVKSHHSNCPATSCLLAHFLHEYSTSKKRVISDRPLVDHYDKMGIMKLPVDCGDFLRAFLMSICADPPEHASDQEDLTPIFRLGLEWKYECSSCKRFSVVHMQDFVLRIDGSREGSLEELLNRFLHQKQCKCGHLCQVYPGVRSAGKYIFLEIDRSIKSVSNEEEDFDEESKDLALYSLQLNESYNVFGFCYALLGTINYKLDSDEGGHYVTNLFPNKNELIRIHETDCKTIKRLPDFDVDTVVVALQKIEMTANNLRRIELEIEYETFTLSNVSLPKDLSICNEILRTNLAKKETKNIFIANSSTSIEIQNAESCIIDLKSAMIDNPPSSENDVSNLIELDENNLPKIKDIEISNLSPPTTSDLKCISMNVEKHSNDFKSVANPKKIDFTDSFNEKIEIIKKHLLKNVPKSSEDLESNIILHSDVVNVKKNYKNTRLKK